ncbi:GyrI-like domain-containing protein [Streptomyces sp. NPDC046887]|uniref:GyrI-like domain-containing protein n=1 Tax=Streptomyces sp. NPDC046887 TaxID=3155472 RepID=UPI0033F63ED4
MARGNGDLTAGETPGADGSVTSGPEVRSRPEQPYVFLRRTVRMDGFAAIADRLPELAAWLAARDVQADGAPFFRYNSLHLDGESEVEAGIPVAALPEPEGDVGVALLPAGRYAVVTHTGPPDLLPDTEAALRDWARAEGLDWDMREVDGVEHWGCRLEVLRTDPRAHPDPAHWQTDLAFRLADTGLADRGPAGMGLTDTG